MLSFALAAASLAYGQHAPAAGPQKPATAPAPATGALPPPASPQPDPAAAVPAGETIISIHGICPGEKKDSGCETAVTKEQFEKLIAAVSAGNQVIPPAQKRNLAQAYVELMAYAQAAAQAGIENDPRFQESMRVLRLQKLAEYYRRGMEEKSRNITPEEIQDWYNKNQARYEELTLSHIFLPKNNPASKDKDAWEKKAAQLAQDLREQAAKGGDLEKLQKEAYAALELTSPPPPVAVGPRRRGFLPAPEEEAVFALKNGEVSKVITEQHAYLIYKLESRQIIPLDRVRDEISREISRQKIEARNKAITGAVHSDLNDKYFGAPPAPATPPAHGDARPPAAPARPPAAVRPVSPR